MMRARRPSSNSSSRGSSSNLALARLARPATFFELLPTARRTMLRPTFSTSPSISTRTSSTAPSTTSKSHLVLNSMPEMLRPVVSGAHSTPASSGSRTATISTPFLARRVATTPSPLEDLNPALSRAALANRTMRPNRLLHPRLPLRFPPHSLRRHLTRSAPSCSTTTPLPATMALSTL